MQRVKRSACGLCGRLASSRCPTPVLQHQHCVGQQRSCSRHHAVAAAAAAAAGPFAADRAVPGRQKAKICRVTCCSAVARSSTAGAACSSSAHGLLLRGLPACGLARLAGGAAVAKPAADAVVQQAADAWGPSHAAAGAAAAGQGQGQRWLSNSSACAGRLPTEPAAYAKQPHLSSARQQRGVARPLLAADPGRLGCREPGSSAATTAAAPAAALQCSSMASSEPRVSSAAGGGGSGTAGAASPPRLSTAAASSSAAASSPVSPGCTCPSAPPSAVASGAESRNSGAAAAAAGRESAPASGGTTAAGGGAGHAAAAPPAAAWGTGGAALTVSAATAGRARLGAGLEGGCSVNRALRPAAGAALLAPCCCCCRFRARQRSKMSPPPSTCLLHGCRSTGPDAAAGGCRGTGATSSRRSTGWCSGLACAGRGPAAWACSDR